MLNIRISRRVAAVLLGRARIAATRGAMILADGPDMNTHSACWRGELPAARRGAGLIQHRRALRRRLAEMNGVEPVIVALVLDAMHLRRIGEDAARAIAQHRVVLPASFPELVDQLHIFVGDVVAVVMRGLLVLAGAAGGAVEIAGHHVPADPALGQMIERRHSPRERIGRLIGQIAGDAEAEMLGHRGHRRDQHQRLVRGRLRRVAQRRIRTVAIDVVDAEHVGEEQPVATCRDAMPILAAGCGALRRGGPGRTAFHETCRACSPACTGRGVPVPVSRSTISSKSPAKSQSRGSGRRRRSDRPRLRSRLRRLRASRRRPGRCRQCRHARRPPHRPDPVRISAGDILHRGAAGVVLDMVNFLVEVVGREIDARPAGHQRERALGADVAAIVGELRPASSPCARE